MQDPQLLAAWMALLSASLHSGTAGQQAWAQLAGQPELEKAMRQWWAQAFARSAAPPAGDPPDSAVLQGWIAEWQKSVGIVPRDRYLALLEENDTLRHRLREAEATIERLRSRQSGDAPTTPNPIGGAWSQIVQDSLKTQAEWFKNWQSAAGTDAPGDDPVEDTP